MHKDTEPGSENYEQSDVQLKIIVICGLVVIGLTLVSFVTSYEIVRGLDKRPAMTDHRPHELREPHNEWNTEVRLQHAPWNTFAAFENEQVQVEDNYGEVSANPPIYSIPVEEAMQLVLKEGRLPEFQAPIALESSMTHDATPEETPQQ